MPVSGVKSIELPAPTTTIDATMPPHTTPSCRDGVSDAIPTADRVSPATSSLLGSMRSDSRPTKGARSIEVSEAGAMRAPVSSGASLSPSWRTKDRMSVKLRTLMETDAPASVMSE